MLIVSEGNHNDRLILEVGLEEKYVVSVVVVVVDTVVMAVQMGPSSTTPERKGWVWKGCVSVHACLLQSTD